MLATSLSLLGGLALLTVGGEWLVRGAAAMALRFGLSPLVVGLTVVAFGTSSPELAVSLDSALNGLGDLAVGNVVGSNICNVALILGLAALLRPIRIDAQLIRLDVPLMIAASLLLALLLADGRLGRGVGLLCLIALSAWVAMSVRMTRRERAGVQHEFAEGVPSTGARRWLCVIMIAAGLAALFIGGRLFVGGAVELARNIGVSEAVIGLTVVAVGTSLPELATSIVGALRSQGDIAIGNVVGSNLFNILGILGITAAVAPLEAQGVGWTDLAVMIAVAVLLFPLARSGNALSRAEGALLVSVYLGYTAWLFLSRQTFQ